MRLYAETFGVLFALPAYSGLGGHWNLDRNEAEQLAERFDAAASQFPESKINAFLARLEKWMPSVMFLVTLASLIWIRYQENVRLANEAFQRQQERDTAPAGYDRGPEAEPTTADGTAPIGTRRAGRPAGNAQRFAQQFG